MLVLVFTVSFNRTFMELKLDKKLKCCTEKASFNRTFMELKLDTIITAIGAIRF